MSNQDFRNYWDAIKRYLADPSKKNRGDVFLAADSTEGVWEEYFDKVMPLTKQLEDFLDALIKGDKQVWMKFLFSFTDDYLFQQFKAFSPFAGQMLIAVDYGVGFVNLHGDIRPFVESLIKDGKGWKTYDGDKYMVTMPNLDKSKAGVVWVGCGYSDVYGPRGKDFNPSTWDSGI